MRKGLFLASALMLASMSFGHAASVFNGSGSGTGNSASGFTASTSAGGGDSVHFDSFGTASSTVNVTPFSTNSASQHSGNFNAAAGGGGFVSAQVQTFAQSNGANAFSMKLQGPALASFEGGATFGGF